MDKIIRGYRKIIKYGSGLAISLPKEWVEWHRLKPGDEVAIVANKELIVIPPSLLKV